MQNKVEIRIIGMAERIRDATLGRMLGTLLVMALREFNDELLVGLTFKEYTPLKAILLILKNPASLTCD